MIATPGVTGATMGSKPYIWTDEYGNQWKFNQKTGKNEPYEPHGIDRYMDSFYIGYNSNTGVSGRVGPVSVGQNGITFTGQTQSYINTRNKPIAYSRTTAKTATDIAQGGMTKDELIDFNLKHPNETMIRGQ